MYWEFCRCGMHRRPCAVCRVRNKAKLSYVGFGFQHDHPDRQEPQSRYYLSNTRIPSTKRIDCWISFIWNNVGLPLKVGKQTTRQAGLQWRSELTWIEFLFIMRSLVCSFVLCCYRHCGRVCPRRQQCRSSTTTVDPARGEAREIEQRWFD